MFTTVGYDSDDSPNTSVLAGANSSLGGSVLRLPGNNPGNVEFYTQGASGTHSHSVSIPAHSHNFSTPNHSHSVTIPSHVHDVSIPNQDRKSTRLNSSHVAISYAVFCVIKKKNIM